MEKIILVGGKAQQGTAITSLFLGKTFCRLGYYVFNYRDYPSLISGGHNFNVLRISEKPVFSHKNHPDIIIALDQNTVNLHQKDLKKGGFILGRKGLKSSRQLYSLDTVPLLEKLKAPAVFENDIFLGWLFRYFGTDKDFLFKEAKKDFGEKSELIIKTLDEGYKLSSVKEKLKKTGKAKRLISGNEAMALGAIAGGMDIYFSYPMTPITQILQFLAKKQLEYNILVFQAENEIAAVNSALGASFGGAKTMVGTSGGGFALMAEALSMAGMAELPLVVYLGQRTAPSTGVPTYTGQGDLKFALNAGQGEFPRIVSAPGDPQEAIIRTQEAFFLSSKYRAPAIILGDKHLGESNYSFDEIKKSLRTNKRFILENPPTKYLSYKIIENGVSPCLVPGQGPVARANSYEHNEAGNTIEDESCIIKMNDKRLKKLKYLKREISKLKPFSVFGKGKNLIVGWGSTKGAIIDALPELKNFKFLQISYLEPFLGEEIKKEIKKAEKVILVENNATGLLGKVISENIGLILENKVLKYDGRPFTADYLIKEIFKLTKK